MNNYKGLFTFDVDNHRYLPIEQADGLISDMFYNPEPKEEPKELWFIAHDGSICSSRSDLLTKEFEKIGLAFETEEEAEKAVEKLKAWKRLRDRGFKFKGYNAQAFGEIKFSIEDDWEDCNFDHLQHKADLDLLFGGEE